VKQSCAAVPRCPGVGVQSGGGSDVAQAASDVGRVEGGAVFGGEHEIVVGAPGSRLPAGGGLPVLLLAQRDDGSLRQGDGAP
jgi:hypothetical protein